MLTSCEVVPAYGKESSAPIPGGNYWAKPLPSFGDPNARILIVRLAPAANGANRTGRMFTGDRSGYWLFETLHLSGFASQPVSVDRTDGLRLKNCYITAAVHCAPPANKPTREEFDACHPYLLQELRLLKRLRVVVVLGQVAFDEFLKAYRANGRAIPKPRPHFSHGGIFTLSGTLTLLTSYHPSQQNTFTGKLTRRLFRSVFHQAHDLIHEASPG